MPKRKKSETIQQNNSESNNYDQGHFTYCGQRNCPHTECLRHNVNSPWNVMFYRSNFNPGKDWNCKDMVLERER